MRGEKQKNHKVNKKKEKPSAKAVSRAEHTHLSSGLRFNVSPETAAADEKQHGTHPEVRSELRVAPPTSRSTGVRLQSKTGSAC